MNKFLSIIVLILFGLNSGMTQSKNFKDVQFGSEQIINSDHVQMNPIDENIDWNAVTRPSTRLTYQSIDFANMVKLENKLKASYYIDGIPTILEGQIEHKKTGTFSNKAQEYLNVAKTQMQIIDAEKEFKLVKEWNDEIGMNHSKFNQLHNGIEIFGSEVIVHGNEDVRRLNGKYFPTSDLADVSTSIKFSEEQAKALIKKQLVNYKDEVAFAKSKQFFPAMKQWEVQQVILPIEKTFTSVWHIKVYANLAEYFTYFIDTNSGAIVRKYTNICKFHDHSHDHSHDHGPGECNHEDAIVDGPTTANATDLLGNNRTINTYEVGTQYFLVDASRNMYNASASNMPDEGVGVVHTIDAFNTAPQNNDFNYDHVSSNNNSWGGSPEGVSAHYNGGQAYLYFKNVHGRQSISGDGSNIYSLVNVANENGGSMGNAFWNGTAIFYGNGDSNFFSLGRSLDVAGHEMSHGVVQATANLEYYGESGAMNESFADVFGSMMDREDWLIGEDVVKTGAFPSGALRDMQDPHNGASTGDYGAGWQPRHTNEQFTGTQDNGGVHINSGIPNYAYYLFATNNSVGKEVAEKVWYRALNNYLTKSSQFVDLRAAVTLAAQDLYDNSVVTAANQAFDQVGIASGGAVPNNYERDAVVNPGTDLLVFSDGTKSNLFIKEISTGNYFTFANPLTQTNQISRPSVTDAGDAIVFAGEDKKLYLIQIDWDAGTATQGILNEEIPWRNVIVSKDGSRIAALTDTKVNEIFVFDYGLSEGVNFELVNPTYSSDGTSTNDVDFADAMEFDLTGENIVYDAQNTISSNNAGSIQYWDISFINVFDNNAGTWGTGDISKLFNQLPENVSVGNPTFSKNSPYILAFDLLEQNEQGIDDFKMVATNLERGDVGELFLNLDLSWPNYSRDDERIVFDLAGFTGGFDVGDLTLNNDKITTVPNSEGIEEIDARWPVWFSNGDRPLTDVEDIEIVETAFDLFPNPVSDLLNINIGLSANDDAMIKVIDMNGKILLQQSRDGIIGENQWTFKVDKLPPGQYLLKVQHENKIYAQKFVKM